MSATPLASVWRPPVHRRRPPLRDRQSAMRQRLHSVRPPRPPGIAKIQRAELEIPNSTLSHHLEKLKNENLVSVRRDRQFLWYSANTETLTELLAFLYSECCSRSGAVRPESVVIPVKSLARRKQ